MVSCFPMRKVYKLVFKRLLDIFLSIIGLVILFPVIVAVAGLVRVFLGTPVIFKQQRPGLQGKIFTIYKFRTMKNFYGNDGVLLSDDERLTNFGKILRKSSLDELPELFNVIRGDMSLVGPRPLLVEYLPLYTADQAKRHDVLPGITGWVQVNGRNSLNWDDKLKLDAWYVDHQSFWLDIKILCLTIAKVLNCTGINQRGQVTVENFRGSQRD